MMIQIVPDLALPAEDLEWSFSRSSGPGGQNINKLSTKATLAFDIGRCRALSDAQRARLRRRLAHRLTREGVLRVSSSRFRTQSANRDDALARFRRLLADALCAERPRRPTRPTSASIRRRLEAKAHRSRIKRTRRADISDEA